MSVQIDDFNMGHGSSRSLTRNPEEALGGGVSLVKKLPYTKFYLTFTFLSGFLTNLKIFKMCKDKRCLTCPIAASEQINPEANMIFCKNSNCIYCIQCLKCNLYYVGQTGNPMNIRINGHRSAIKNYKGSEKIDIEYEHFQSHCFNNIKLYILDFVANLNDRLNLENYYIAKLHSLYPYGLNSSFNGNNFISNLKCCIYEKLNLSYAYGKRRGCRGRGKSKSFINFPDYFKDINTMEFNSDNIKALKIRVFSLKNSAIKFFIRNHLGNFSFKNETFKDVLLDLFKFKLKTNDLLKFAKPPTNPIEFMIVNFQHKAYDNINFSNIFRINQASFPLGSLCRIKTVFKYSRNLKQIICNYNQNSKNINLIDNDNDCHCHLERFKPFVDHHHQHIITGNLDIIENIKLKNIMSKGSKFRPHIKINISNFVSTFIKDLDVFCLKLAFKYNSPIESFKEWKINTINSFKSSLKNIYFGNVSDYIIDFNLKKEIQALRKMFVVTTVDKADNNFAFICKKYYKYLLMNEYNISGNFVLEKSKDNVIKKCILAHLKKLKLKHDNFNFPYLFITVKFHKNPVNFRFVTCGSNTYNSRAGEIFLNKLKIILNYIHEKSHTFIINNNRKVLDFLNHNTIDKIETYDFESLFTNIPQEKIFPICNEFYLTLQNIMNCDLDFWNSLVKFCVCNNFLFNGVNYYKQANGIPMGSKFSSALANIFLHFFEKDLINLKIKAFRYIDDLIVFNSPDFKNIFPCIYPAELTLKNTSDNDNGYSFLDLNIRIEKTLKIGVYDKRKNFNFNVVSLTNKNSCISNSIHLNTFISQLIRVKNICNNKTDYNIAQRDILTSLIGNGFQPVDLRRMLLHRRAIAERLSVNIDNISR